MAAARIDMTNQKAWRGEFEQRELCDGRFDFFCRHAQSNRRQRFPRYRADCYIDHVAASMDVAFRCAASQRHFYRLFYRRAGFKPVGPWPGKRPYIGLE